MYDFGSLARSIALNLGLDQRKLRGIVIRGSEAIAYDYPVTGMLCLELSLVVRQGFGAQNIFFLSLLVVWRRIRQMTWPVLGMAHSTAHLVSGRFLTHLAQVRS